MIILKTDRIINTFIATFIALVGSFCVVAIAKVFGYSSHEAILVGLAILAVMNGLTLIGLFHSSNQ